MWHMILLIILQISEIYQPFLFSVEYLVSFIICECYFMGILCYLTVPWTKPWKYVSKKCDKRYVSLVCIDRWKSDIAAFLELNPGIFMTHRHPANRKIGSPFVPPGETEFHSGPRTNTNTNVYWYSWFSFSSFNYSHSVKLSLLL